MEHAGVGQGSRGISTIVKGVIYQEYIEQWEY